MTSPDIADLLGYTVGEVAQNASRLGLDWTLRPASVSDPGDPTSIVVLVTLDGDLTPIRAISLIGTLPTNARVMTVSVPPQGVYVIGWYSINPYSIGVRKLTSTSRANTGVTTADPHLVLTLPASSFHEIELILLDSSAANAAGDLLFDLSWTGTVIEVDVGIHGPHNTIASGSQSDLESAGRSSVTSSPAGAFVVGASTSVNMTLVKGIVQTDTAITMHLNWGQFSSNPNATTLLKGSSFVARPVTMTN